VRCWPNPCSPVLLLPSEVSSRSASASFFLGLYLPEGVSGFSHQLRKPSPHCHCFFRSFSMFISPVLFSALALAAVQTTTPVLHSRLSATFPHPGFCTTFRPWHGVMVILHLYPSPPCLCST
jgi:Na+/H+-dicarboxylate symporter